MMWAGLLVMLVPLTLTLACVVGLVILWVRVFRRAQHGMPTCGKCGYGVYGATSLTCSECGGDFRQVGIDTAKQRGAVGPAVFGILWTVLLPLPALIAIGLMIAYGPQHAYTIHSLNLAPTPPAGSQLSNVGIEQAWGGSPWSMGPDPSRITMNASANASAGSYVHAEIDLTSFTFANTYGGNTSGNLTAPASGTAVTDASVLALLGGTGASTTDPTVQAHASDVVKVLQSLRTQGLGTHASALPPTPTFTVQNNSWQNDQPATWWVVSVLAFWLLFWIAGFVIFTLVRRAQHRAWERELAAQPAPPAPLVHPVS